MNILDNSPRWINGSKKPFYEVWYLKFNPSSKDFAIWLRFTLLRRKKSGVEIAETWAIFTDARTATPKKWGFKSTFPISSFDGDSRQISIHGSFLTASGSNGTIENASSQISWNLQFKNESKSFSHVPTLFEKLKLNKATVYTPFPNLECTGTVAVSTVDSELKSDREVFLLDKARGMQGHIFGIKNGQKWAWGHCNLVDSGKPFVFEGITAHIQLGGLITSPPISAFLIEWNGQRYEFNSTKDALTADSESTLEYWSIKLRRGAVAFHITISARICDFAGVTYEDTDGSLLYCHNSKISNLEVDIFEVSTKVDHIVATTTCAYEWVSRHKDPRVEFVL